MAATKAARDRAEQIDRERDRLELAGVTAAVRLGRTLFQQIADLMALGLRNFSEPLANFERDVAQVFASAMTASHLTGAASTFAAAEPRLRAARPLAFQLLERATEAAAALIDVDDATLAAMANQYSQDAVSVTRSIGSEIEDKLRVVIARNIEEGRTVPQGTAAVREEFRNIGIIDTRVRGPIPAGTKRVVGKHLFETLFRTQVQISYSAGRWEMLQDPAFQEVLWGHEYVTVGDDRVRPRHEIMDGMRFAKDDPRWRTLWPPNGFACRCSTIEIFLDERIANTKQPPDSRVIDGKTFRPEPDEGFAFNPGIVRSLLGGSPAARNLV